MGSYILKTGLNIRLSNQSIDYNLVGSVVTFEEIEDQELRDRLVVSFLKEGYIVEADGEKPVVKQTEPDTENEGDKSEEGGDKSEEGGENTPDEEEGDLDDFEKEADEEADEEADANDEKAPKSKATKSKGVKGGKV